MTAPNGDKAGSITFVEPGTVPEGKSIRCWSCGSLNMLAAQAALTAAAEVDTMANPVARLDAGGANFAPQAAIAAAAEHDAAYWKRQYPSDEDLNADGERLEPAAAEVGEDAPCNDVEWEKAKRDLVTRTIERCCEIVAANEEDWHTSLAAIRALKDK